MQLIQATSADFAAIQTFYAHVVSHTLDMPTYGRWKQGLYPTEEDFNTYIQGNSMYLYKERRKDDCRSYGCDDVPRRGLPCYRLESRAAR